MRHDSVVDDRFLYALQLALRTGLAKSGDTVVLAHGLKSGKSRMMLRIALKDGEAISVETNNTTSTAVERS